MKKPFYILTFIISSILNAAQENTDNKNLEVAIENAVQSTDLQEMENLLQNSINTDGAFHFLIDSFNGKNIEVIEQILNLFIKYKLDINQLYSYETVLYYSLSKHSNFEIIQLLIKYAANVNKGVDHETNKIPPILNTFHNYDCYKLLVENGADINFQTNELQSLTHGDTILLRTIHIFIGNEVWNRDGGKTQFKIILDLLIQGADLTLKRKHLNSTFFDSLNNSQMLPIVNEFINYILEAKGINDIKGAQNALLIAAYLNKPDLVKQLLEKGVCFNSEKYTFCFNNLIADKPAIHRIVDEYKNNYKRNISEGTQVIPDIVKMIAEY